MQQVCLSEAAVRGHEEMQHSTTNYDDVIDATSEFNCSVSETGSVFNVRMNDLRRRYEPNHDPDYVGRQQHIGRIRRDYMAQFKEEIPLEDRQLGFTIQQWALDRLEDDEHMYGDTEEDCVMNFIALARLRRCTHEATSVGIAETQVKWVNWIPYEEGEEYEESEDEAA
jgi:hypothetical protein